MIQVPGHQIFSWPSWVGPGMVVSALAPKETTKAIRSPSSTCTTRPRRRSSKSSGSGAPISTSRPGGRPSGPGRASVSSWR